MMFVVGWNMPGYLPESEPERFLTWVDAKTHLAVTLDDWCEDDLQSVGWAPATEQDVIASQIVDRYAGVIDAVIASDGPSFAMEIAEQNVVVWIAQEAK